MAFTTNKPNNARPPFQRQQGGAKPQGGKPQGELQKATKPDFIVKVKDAETGKYVRIGGAWTTDRGGFKLTFDPGVNITSTEAERFKCMLFPNDYEKKDAEA